MIHFEDRVRLLRRVLAEPKTEIATNVEMFRRYRAEYRGLDFEDLRLILRAESDRIVAKLREESSR